MAVKLDLDKLNSRMTQTISTEEALKDVTPFYVDEQVSNGSKQIYINKAEKDKKAKKDRQC